MHIIKNEVKNKIKSNTGASVLIAMVLFLVAVMVSAVIISAALTSFKSVHKEINSQQKYLSVSSAGRLIGEGLRHSSVTKTEVEISGTENDGTPITPSSETTFTYSGPLGAYLAYALKIDIASEHVMTIDPGASAEGPDPCVFKFTIYPVNEKDPEEKYTMKGTIGLDGNEEVYKAGPKIYVMAYCSYNENTQVDIPSGRDNVRITTNTQTWTWNTVWMNTIGEYKFDDASGAAND